MKGLGQGFKVRVEVLWACLKILVNFDSPEFLYNPYKGVLFIPKVLNGLTIS